MFDILIKTYWTFKVKNLFSILGIINLGLINAFNLNLPMKLWVRFVFVYHNQKASKLAFKLGIKAFLKSKMIEMLDIKYS